MNISTKHQNQQVTMLQNFAGGLCTTLTDENIDATQLSSVVNMEINNGGQLRTVLGTKVVCDMSAIIESPIKDSFYDNINSKLLVFTEDGYTFTYKDGEVELVGRLNGDDAISCVCWEDGVLIASGGGLQYAKPTDTSEDGVESLHYKLNTIADAPKDCGGVYVRSGRVFVFDSLDNLRYSGVGDESYWVQDTNDPSAAIFTQIGYKVGGKILGLINFQSFVLIIKDNGKIFRLENEYPDWVIKEVTSNGMCKSKTSYTSIGEMVFILGDKTMQAISPMDSGDNMPINYVGKQIENEIASLPKNTKMRFLPEKNQLWFITGTQWVLVYDCITQTFFQRYFNSRVVDVSDKYIVKADKICEFADGKEVLMDDDKPLKYSVKFKTEMALNDILVKHVDFSITPLVSFYEDAGAMLKVGRINMPFPNRKASTNKILRTVGIGNDAYELSSTDLLSSRELFLDSENVSTGKSILYKKRQICRCHRVDVEINGEEFPFILNFISYNKVEV